MYCVRFGTKSYWIHLSEDCEPVDEALEIILPYARDYTRREHKKVIDDKQSDKPKMDETLLYLNLADVA